MTSDLPDNTPNDQPEGGRPGEPAAARFRFLPHLALLGALLPFVNKAVHVDDAAYLAVAGWMRFDLWTPYNQYLNWLGEPRRAFETIASPFGHPLLLSLLMPLAGGREWIFHAAYLVFPVIVLEAVLRLARRFLGGIAGASPAMITLAVLLCILNPAFIVTAGSLMPDLPMLAAYFGGLALVIRGIDEDRPGLAAGGGFAAGLSAIFRYNGLTVIPLILLYGGSRRRLSTGTLKLTVLAALTAAVPFGLWCAQNIAAYGETHFHAMVRFENTLPAGEIWWIRYFFAFEYQLLGLGMAAPGFAALAGFAVSGHRRRTVLYVCGLALAGSVILSLIQEDNAPTAALKALAFGSALLCLLALFSHDWKTGLRSMLDGMGSDDIFLFCWTAGILVFNLKILSLGVRYLLPLVPPLVFLLWRYFRPGAPALRAAVIGTAVLGLGVGTADYLQAGTNRDFAAVRLPEIVAGLQAKYAGTIAGSAARPLARPAVGYMQPWGFQYYMNRAGAVQLSRNTPEPAAPMVMVFPFMPYLQAKPPPWLFRRGRFEISKTYPGWFPVRTISDDPRTLFYGFNYDTRNFRVSLPWSFSSRPLEEFVIYWVPPARPDTQAGREESR